MVEALHVSIPVLDVRRSAELYCSLFGLEIKANDSELAQLYLGNNRVSLRRVNSESSSLQGGGTKSVRARHFGFRVSSAEELQSILDRVKSLGLQLVEDIHERDEEPCFFFIDLSGNQIEVFVDTMYGGL